MANVNKIFLSLTLLFVMMFTINFTSADVQVLPSVIQGNCAELPQQEFNTTYQTLTYVQGPAPAKTLYTINTNMTDKGGDYYIYNFCNTSSVGTYVVNGYSDLSTWTYTFDVIPMGSTNNSAFTVFIILSIVAFLVLIVSILMKNHYIVFIAGAIFIVAGMMPLIYGISDVNNLYTQTVGYIFIGLGLFFVLASAYSMVDSESIFRQAIERDETDYFEED